MKEKVEKTIDEVKSLDAKQLKKLQEFEEFSKKVKEVLGDLSLQYELAKSEVLSQFYSQLNKINELKKEISDEHGEKINVDIQTGIITNQEEVNKK